MYGYIFAILLYLSSATAVSVGGLRLSDFAVGLLLVLLVKECKAFRLARLEVALLFLMIVCSVALSQFASLLGGEAVQDVQIKEAMSIVVGVVMSILLLSLNDVKLIELMNKYSYVVIVGNLMLLAWFWTYGSPAWIVRDEEFSRFSGISQNPNQLALYLLPVPFFILMVRVAGGKSWQSSLVQLVFVVCINVASFGKALFVGWAVSFVFLYLLGFVLCGNVKLNNWKMFVRLLSVIFVGVVSIPIFNALYSGDAAGSQEGQGDIRLQLWQHGLDAWSDAFWVGHGPGHYSGLDAAYGGVEAHNMIIDWLSAYGVLGGCLFVGLFSWLIKIAVDRRMWLVCALYIALLVQISFHFYGRQPLFWMILAFGCGFSYINLPAKRGRRSCAE